MAEFCAVFQNQCGFGGKDMPSKKLKLIAVISAIVIIGSVFMVGEAPLRSIPYAPIDHHTPSDVIFKYDFDDGNLSDWYSFAIDDGTPYNVYPANVSVVNGAMQMGADHYNIAFLNSSVAYGTWSFDVFVVDQPIDHEIVIPFIMIEYRTDCYMMQAYFFQIVTGDYVPYPHDAEPDQFRVQAGKARLQPSTRYGRIIEWFGHYDTDDIWGWKQFNITREHNGQFYIYMNGSLVLGFKDTQHTSCNEFGFSSRISAFDNLVIDDNITYDAAPPEWNPEPVDKMIDVGTNFRYDLNATDFSGLGTWNLNDTTKFAIDSNGVITNNTALVLGSYGLNVTVSDSLGFTRAAVFSVTVQPAQIDAQPDLTLYLIAGGAGIIIIALVIVFMKKRG
jgi:hypothetical protein